MLFRDAPVVLITYVTNIITAIVLSGLLASVSGRAANGRPMEVTDVYKREGIGRGFGGAISFSSDGRKLAIVRERAGIDRANFKMLLNGGDNSDVWVQSEGGQLVNITRGHVDGSGWWAPQWSPDGRFLAMLSTRGERIGSNVWVWIWDSKANTLRQMAPDGVNIDSWENLITGPCRWLVEYNLSCAMLPRGRAPRMMTLEQRTQQLAPVAWEKAAAGRGVTASVLDAGMIGADPLEPDGQLAVINTMSGVVSTIAKGEITGLLVSPSRKEIAYARKVGTYHSTGSEIKRQIQNEMYVIEVADYRGRRILSTEREANDYVLGSLRWSLSGKEIAFLSFGTRRSEAPKLFTAAVADGGISQHPIGNLDGSVDQEAWNPQLEWTIGGSLLLRAVERRDNQLPAFSSRRDWWHINRDGTWKKLTGAMQQVPTRLFRIGSSHSYLGAAGQAVWRIGTDGEIKNITEKMALPVKEIVWPSGSYTSSSRQYAPAGSGISALIFSVHDAGNTVYYRYDPVVQKAERISSPEENAVVVAATADADDIIFLRSDRSGLRLWRNSTDGSRRSLLVDANKYLSGISMPETMKIEYTSMDGEKLKGWIILPVGYKRGKRYPLITWVYPGDMQDDIPPSDTLHPYSLHIPASRGYAVLLPSLPLNRYGDAEDVMLRLPNGVLPAVDAAVEIGVADPEQLFLMGQSYGGFAVYGLLTQTGRFAAAAAIAGFTNLFSFYGQLDARERYTDSVQEGPSVRFLESGTIPLGGPPWQEFGRYLRNSPIFQVDRVDTPLLIIHGDLDYVPIQQAEEFFVSLARLGRRSRFIRYWGEGHVISSPANVEDMWDRILEWFKEDKK